MTFVTGSPCTEHLHGGFLPLSPSETSDCTRPLWTWPPPSPPSLASCSRGIIVGAAKEPKLEQNCWELLVHQECRRYFLLLLFFSFQIGVGCHSLLQGNLPRPGMEPRSPALQAKEVPFHFFIFIVDLQCCVRFCYITM